jgi:hypothetical protein
MLQAFRFLEASVADTAPGSALALAEPPALALEPEEPLAALSPLVVSGLVSLVVCREDGG